MCRELYVLTTLKTSHSVGGKEPPHTSEIPERCVAYYITHLSAHSGSITEAECQCDDEQGTC